MEKINIVTYADGHYIQHACIMLMSLRDVVDPNRRYHIYIFHANCSKEHISKLQKSLDNFLPKNITYELGECDFGLGKKIKAKREYMNSSIYDKVLIYDKIPLKIEKVLFLDADIVLQRDPSDLFDQNVENYYVGAVKDQVFENFTEEAKKTLSISKDEYFNTGVMLVNLNLWREFEVSRKSLDFALDKWDKTPYHDQDAFNYVVKGQWIEISPLWNPRIKNVVKDKNGAITVYSKNEVYLKNMSFLIHYSGPQKPWFYMSYHPQKDIYLEYLKLSEFRDYKFPDYNFQNFIKKQALNFRRKLYFMKNGN